MTAARLRLDPRRADGVRLYVLITSHSTGGDRLGAPPTEVLASKADARRRFQRLRLEVGARPGWAQLMAVEGDEVRPLCWFGRPTPLAELPRPPQARRQKLAPKP